MSETIQKKYEYIRSDIIRIIVILLLFFIGLVALVYIDSTRHVISSWASDFYNWILRR